MVIFFIKTAQSFVKQYITINAIFAFFIIIIFLYSLVFSPESLNYPIHSQASNTSVSTGLSRAFSEIVRFNFAEAKVLNKYSLSIFLFFFIQLFLRIVVSILLLSTKKNKKLLLLTDILITVLLFLQSFWKFIFAQF